MSTPRAVHSRAGFTLIEVLIATVIGVLVLTASTSLALSTWQSLSGTQLRDGIDRNARFLGISLTRDLQETGVDLESKPSFGSLAVYGDTVTILKVPYDPTQAQPYPLSIANSPTGNCGAQCVEVQSTGAPVLAAGNVALFQCLTDRRLIRITGVTAVAGGYAVTFNNISQLLHHRSGKPTISNPTATFVQRLGAVSYWRNGTQLMRATAVSAAGVPQGDIAATGVQAFTPTLVFTDGHEAATADSVLYGQIAAIRVRMTLQADRTNPRVNNGVLLTRPKEWYVVPRNLVYERNRIP